MKPAVTLSHSPPLFESLEALRGIAALLVALFHVSWATHMQGGLARNGYLRVDVFFILSGFVMMYAYGGKLRGMADARRFMLLRIGRVYPLHCAILLAWGAVVLVKYAVQLATGDAPPAIGAQPDVRGFIAHLLLLHSTGTMQGLVFNIPSWSISAEFWAYLVFAGVLLVTNTRTLVPLAMLIVVSSLVLLGSLRGSYDLDASWDFGVLRCLAGFFSGVLAYALYRRLRPGRISALSASLFALCLLSWMMFKHKGANDVLIIPAAALLIVLLASCPQAAVTRLLRWPPLIRLGTLSYSVYMVHYAISRAMAHGVGRLLPQARPDPNDVGLHALPLWLGDALVLLYLAIVLVVANFTWRYIEVPWRERARAWAGRRSDVPVTSTVQAKADA